MKPARYINVYVMDFGRRVLGNRHRTRKAAEEAAEAAAELRCAKRIALLKVRPK